MIDLDAILTPVEGENPAGENLRYTDTYDAIREARREEDALDRGDWDRDVKTADWESVKRLAVEALVEKTKDIQIAVWLMESLVKTEGFIGLDAGLQVTAGLMENFWEQVYPEIEDDDLDYRIGPLEFMNDKLWLAVKQVPLTDPAAGGDGSTGCESRTSSSTSSSNSSSSPSRESVRELKCSSGSSSRTCSAAQPVSTALLNSRRLTLDPVASLFMILPYTRSKILGTEIMMVGWMASRSSARCGIERL